MQFAQIAMMPSRCLVIFTLFLPCAARRSIRIGDSFHDAHRKTTIVKALEVSADTRMALLPRELGKSLLRRRGPPTGASHAADGQGPGFRVPRGQALSMREGVRSPAPPLMTTASDVAGAAGAASAASVEAALLAEVQKTERSLDIIAQSARTLENVELPRTAGKLKRALAASWLLEYASDEAALAPFLTGRSGPFTVVEGIVHTFEQEGDFSSIEVTRRIGPFGNSKNSLCGRWSVKNGYIRWKASYMLDSNGRERDPPKDAKVNEARVTYVSSQLLLLRNSSDTSAGDDGLLVFSRVNLEKTLDELRVSEVDSAD